MKIKKSAQLSAILNQTNTNNHQERNVHMLNEETQKKESDYTFSNSSSLLMFIS